MPIELTRDDARQRFIAVGTGVLTAEDILTFMANQRRGEHRLFALVFDIHDATVTVTAEDLRAFAAGAEALWQAEGPRGPVAIVADRPGVSALARLYEAAAQIEDMQLLRIFGTRAEADEWLAALG